jgi:YD repeat-containing protein
MTDSTTVYDTAGRTVETTDANGIRSGTIYDSAGRVWYTKSLNGAHLYPWGAAPAAAGW